MMFVQIWVNRTARDIIPLRPCLHNLYNNLRTTSKYKHRRPPDSREPRAGANALYQPLVRNKPHVLVPLPATSRRGDQLVNADVMARGGYSVVVADEDLDINNFNSVKALVAFVGKKASA